LRIVALLFLKQPVELLVEEPADQFGRVFDCGAAIIKTSAWRGCRKRCAIIRR
jgi:hypothetical protein